MRAAEIFYVEDSQSIARVMHEKLQNAGHHRLGMTVIDPRADARSGIGALAEQAQPAQTGDNMTHVVALIDNTIYEGPANADAANSRRTGAPRERIEAGPDLTRWVGQMGLKNEHAIPILYYSTTPPPADIAQLVTYVPGKGTSEGPDNVLAVLEALPEPPVPSYLAPYI